MRGRGGGVRGARGAVRDAYRAYLDWLLAHPWLVVAFVTALTLLWASQLPALRVEIDPDANLPQDHPYIRALHVLESKFGEKNLLVIGLFPNDRNVFTPAFLTKLRRITDRVGELPGLVHTSYLGLGAPIAKAIRGGDDTVFVDRILDRPPTSQSEADEVRRRAYLNPFYRGILIAEDGSATALIANFKLTREMPGYLEIRDRVMSVVAAENDGSFTVHLGGPVAILAAMAKVTERTVLLFPIAMILIGLIHYEAFRTFQGMILPLVTALLSVVWALGFMGLLRVPLDPFNTTTPILVLAVTAGHAVQILKRYYEEYDRHRDNVKAIRTAMLRVGPIMVTAALIAALSFFSLTVFATATIRNFGLLTGFGIMSGMIIELSLIPAIRRLLPAPRVTDTHREAASERFLDRALRALGRLVAARPAAVIATAGATMAVAALCATRIHVDTSLKRQFRPSDGVQIDDEALNMALAGTNTLVFVMAGPDDDSIATSRAMQTMRDLQHFVARDPNVGATSSIADLIAEMNMALHGGSPQERMVPDSDDLVRQYLFLYSLSGDPTDLDTQIDQQHRTAAIRTFMKNDSTEYAQRQIADVRAFLAEHVPEGFTVSYSGSNASNAALTEVMVRGKLLNMVQIIAIIVLISGVVLRSIFGGALVSAPLLMAVLVNLGAMGLVGIPLDIVTAPIAAMAVGIGADYAIYFMFRFREELATSRTPELALASALLTSGKAIVYVSSAIAGGYLVLCASGFVYHTELGTMVALAMVVAAFASISFLPALLLVGRPAFLFGGRDAVPVVEILDDVQSG